MQTYTTQMDAVSNMTGEELDQGANYELYC